MEQTKRHGSLNLCNIRIEFPIYIIEVFQFSLKYPLWSLKIAQNSSLRATYCFY